MIILSSANALNLDLSKIISYSKELKLQERHVSIDQTAYSAPSELDLLSLYEQFSPYSLPKG